MKLDCSQHVSNNIQIAYLSCSLYCTAKKKSHAGKNNLKSSQILTSCSQSSVGSTIIPYTVDEKKFNFNQLI